MSGFVVVNTVNTALSADYDFGVHRAGCADLRKAERAGCQLYAHATAVSADEVIDAERADLAGDFGEDGAAAFAFRKFGCCKGGSR